MCVRNTGPSSVTQNSLVEWRAKPAMNRLNKGLAFHAAEELGLYLVGTTVGIGPVLKA